MNTLLNWIAKIALGKHILKAVAWTHDRLDGKRSEITAGLLALAHGLKIAGIIPAEQAAVIENALLALLPLVLADRASKIIKQVDAVIPELPKLAPKEEPKEPEAPAA